MVTYKNIKQEPSTKILLGRLLIGLTGYNGSEIKSKNHNTNVHGPELWFSLWCHYSQVNTLAYVGIQYM